ncbi:MAG: MarR family transcriptional regulator [Candidatus Zixiibacteriota bacterium]
MAKKEMRNRAEVLRDEILIQQRICNLLTEGPLTIPQLAEALNTPSWEVTTWVMAMRRYGLLKELPKNRADDYYQYALSTEESA